MGIEKNKTAKAEIATKGVRTIFWTNLRVGLSVDTEHDVLYGYLKVSRTFFRSPPGIAGQLQRSDRLRMPNLDTARLPVFNRTLATQ